ncbi:MAG TPA: diacylglycerol kinase family protein [Acidimicrobiales bacterium]|nr:diacylglycerol kinase family protein [Acidimicrobiales bacterium]
MKLLLVVNPTASSVTARRRVAVEDILSAGHDLSMVVTTARDHATELARRAPAEGVDVLVVLGGDGTVNEAANGLACSSTALAALPGGSTSVFSRTLGHSNDLVTAARELAAALEAGSRRRMALATANGRRYLFNLGVGFDAEVVAHVERGSLKKRFGQAAFVYSSVATWLSQKDPTMPHLSVKVSGDEATHPGSFVLCLNTNPYTYLGTRPLNVAPGTGFDTRLAVAVLRDVRLATLGKAVRSALGDGHDLGRQAGVTVLTDVEAVTITGEELIPYQVDGEYLGRVDAVEVGLEPDCLEVVLP